MIGVVLRETEDSMAAGEAGEEGEKREWTVAGRFNDFTRWEREANPTKDNMPAKWLKWTQLSSAVCFTIVMILFF